MSKNNSQPKVSVEQMFQSARVPSAVDQNKSNQDKTQSEPNFRFPQRVAGPSQFAANDDQGNNYQSVSSIEGSKNYKPNVSPLVPEDPKHKKKDQGAAGEVNQNNPDLA